MSMGGRLGGSGGGRLGGRAGGGGGFLGLSNKTIIQGAIITGIGALTKKIVTLGMEAEQSKLTLSKLFGSKEEGQKEFKETERFAAFSPFNFDEVLKQRIALGARGVNKENQLPVLEMLGNLASVLGTEKLPFLSKAFGDVLSKGKLQGQEVKQFAEAGVNIKKMVAELRGTSVSEVEGTLIPFTEFLEALQQGSGEGTVFFNAMAEASQTAAGKLESAKDLFDSILRDVGTELLPIITSGIESMGDALLFLQNSSIKQLILDLAGVGVELGKLAGFGGKEGELSTITVFFDSIRVAALQVSKVLNGVSFAMKSIHALATGAGSDRLFDIAGSFNESNARISESFDEIDERGFGRIGGGAEKLTSNLGGAIDVAAFGDSAPGVGTNKKKAPGGTRVSSNISGSSGGRGAGVITINIENVNGIQNNDSNVDFGGQIDSIKEKVQIAMQQVFTDVKIAAG